MRISITVLAYCFLIMSCKTAHLHDRRVTFDSKHLIALICEKENLTKDASNNDFRFHILKTKVKEDLYFVSVCLASKRPDQYQAVQNYKGFEIINYFDETLEKNDKRNIFDFFFVPDAKKWKFLVHTFPDGAITVERIEGYYLDSRPPSGKESLRL